jgi:hypothetical protein
MRDYYNSQFNETIKQLNNRNEAIIHSQITGEDFVSFQYFLTRNLYYAVIIDDYLFEITDKVSFLEAVYYQVRLITMHDLNWDALEESLNDVLNNFMQFEGLCLLFRMGNKLKIELAEEFKMLSNIVLNINKSSERKKITILLNSID